MAAPTNAFLTGASVGNRESLHDKIFMLDKDEFPIMGAIGSGTAKATYEEWQTDTLGSAGTNSNLEGDDSTAAAITATVRVGNRTQILKKAFTISNTQEVVDKAGRDSEIGYQTAKHGRQIKMDLESTICLNTASVAESGATTRKLGGFPTWLTTNDSRGTGGAQGGFSSGNTTVATDGTQRAFTETLLQNVIKLAWDEGGNPNMVVVGSFNKQQASGFSGIATQYQDAKGKVATIVGAADRYVSDFGTFTIVADRYCRTRDALVLDPSMASLLWLRKFKREELAKTGDARKFHIVGEVTLKVNNEAAHGIVADLTTS
ncbi:MAG TPA: DUF5309 domain-containing protein [Reyranellaceae bacterium]|nr:DUF5309 domain-containing protein [Reyranellaceae bacterium]